MVLTCFVVAGGLVAYVSIRPHQPWLLGLTALLAALACDGLVRSNPAWRGRGLFSSLPFLFLPLLTTLAAGLFIHDAVNGFARPALAVAASLLTALVAYGEYHTVDFRSRMYGPVRLILAVLTYLTAFALYAVLWGQDLELPVASVAVGLVSMLLAIELLRESHLSGPSSPLVGMAVGLSLGELRLALYFFPLDELLAGALLIIGFYLATGLVHHLLDRDLDAATASEYFVVALVGTAAVVFTRLLV
ncbi:MAG: hypothetical protein WEC33_04925 [Dehalococcoidia bacterium]